jgi:pantoate--beta-alanine ligase
MGALHRGHTTLIDRARKLVGPQGSVAVSLFVNPTQFGPGEDFSRYPRPLKADRQLCLAHGEDLLFHPSADAMYPEGYSTYISEENVGQTLCGAARPGHYRGVCTVVAKLFGIIRPDMALFGLKDFQQCMVIRKMVRDLHFAVQIVPVETVREADGLALSSRNQYLTPEERAQAPVLRQALLEAAQAIKQGETRVTMIRSLLLKRLSKAPLARIDYAEIASAETLQPTPLVTHNCVIALAVFFGKTRLIDNIWLR